jgi:hypothetical protein
VLGAVVGELVCAAANCGNIAAAADSAQLARQKRDMT